jgi:hypothetical protein
MTDSTKVIAFYPSRCVPPSEAAHGFDGFYLQPGMNYNVPEDSIALLTKHPDYPRYQKWKAIEIITPEQLDVEDITLTLTQSDALNLSAYAEDDAEGMVLQAESVDQLTQWLATETRRKVRTKINQRIAALKGE